MHMYMYHTDSVTSKLWEQTADRRCFGLLPQEVPVMITEKHIFFLFFSLSDRRCDMKLTSLAPVPHLACTISSTVCVVGARFCRFHKHVVQST